MNNSNNYSDTNQGILDNYGGLNANDFIRIFNGDSNDQDQSSLTLNQSNYHDLSDLLSGLVFKDQTQFKVLSFNTESLPSKIDNIKTFIETLKSEQVSYDAISVTECWLEQMGSDLGSSWLQLCILPRESWI